MIDAADNLTPIEPAAHHVYHRAKVLPNGSIVWQCPHCTFRCLTPPGVVSVGRAIILRPGDPAAIHVRNERDAWPSWPSLEARSLYWFDLS